MLHVIGSVSDIKEFGGDLIDAFVSALCGEEHCNKEGVGVAMVEWRWRIRVSIIEDLANSLSFLLSFQVWTPDFWRRARCSHNVALCSDQIKHP